MIEEPIGGAALAAAAIAAAEALVGVARASGDERLAQRAEVLRLRVAGTARVNASRYPRALGAREAAADLSQEERDEQIGEAYARAAEPPLELARISADMVELAADIAGDALLGLRTDAVVAGLIAAATARGAAMLVAINLTAPRDDPRVAEAEQYAAAAELAVDRLAALP
jgi:methenyltetrahydrofolate cyclohydrolase